MKTKAFKFLPRAKTFIVNAKITATRKEISTPQVVTPNTEDPYEVNIHVDIFMTNI